MTRFLFILSALIFAATPLVARDFTQGPIVIHQPWTRATPEGATTGVGYLNITNKGPESDWLTGGTFDGADAVEIHEMKMTGDVMSMRRIADGLEIKPGQTIAFQPMSYHLMMTGLKKPIALGTDVTGTLLFKNAGPVTVNYKVEAFGATMSHDSHD